MRLVCRCGVKRQCINYVLYGQLVWVRHYRRASCNDALRMHFTLIWFPLIDSIHHTYPTAMLTDHHVATGLHCNTSIETKVYNKWWKVRKDWVVEQKEDYKNSYDSSHIYTYKGSVSSCWASSLRFFFLPTRNLSIHFRAPDIQNTTMSFTSLPIEIITHIFDLLDESDAEMKLEIDKHRKMCKALMALRLTCKELDGIATRQLFRTLHMSPSRVSWLNVHTVVANQELRVHLQTLAFDRYTDGASHEHKLQDAIKSPSLAYLDFSLFPNLNRVKVDDQWMIRKKKSKQCPNPTRVLRNLPHA